MLNSPSPPCTGARNLSEGGGAGTEVNDRMDPPSALYFQPGQQERISVPRAQD